MTLSSRPQQRSSASQARRGQAGPTIVLELDRVHIDALEAAMDLDRGYFDRHPSAAVYVRPMLEHEMCATGCQPAAGRLVRVGVVAPGLRARFEVWA